MTRADRILLKERCRRDAHYFIFDSRKLLTKDEHDQYDPVKPFPDVPYLRVVLDCLLVSGRFLKPEEARHALLHGIDVDFLAGLYDLGIFCVEKSRQIMATWITCAYLLWRAKFRAHQLILVQSKREDDAANLVFNKDPTVGRISFMEYGLPEALRSVDFPKDGSERGRTKRGGATYGQLFFPTGSRIWAIPEGGDIIRSNTPSVIFSDEAAFQPEFGSSYTAAAPAVHGGGQYIAVSSAEPGEYMELIEAA